VKNLSFAIVAFCVLVGAFGAYGLLDGPYVGAELERGESGIWVASVAPGSPAELAGMVPGARLVSIAGLRIGPWDLEADMDVIPERAALLSNFAVQAALGGALRPGVPVAYALEAPGGTATRLTVTPARMPLARALSRLAQLYLPALFCLAVGLAVVLKKPGDRRVRLFFAMLATVSLSLLTFGAWSSRDTAMAPFFFLPLAAVNELYSFPFFPVLFLRFCLSFPRDLKPARNRALMAALLLSPLAMVAVFLPRLAFEVQSLFWAAGLLGGAAVMARQYSVLRSPALRAQVKWILWGAIVFGICMVLVYTLPILLRRPSYSNWLLSTFVFLVIPLSFAFGILRYRLMDIDALFDATFVYTITAGLLLAIDVLLSLGLGLLAGQAMPRLDILSSSIAVLLAIVLYQPLRARIAALVKRLFRREIYEPAEVASRVADRLLLARDAGEAVEVLRKAVDSTLHPSSTSVVLLAPGAAAAGGSGAEGAASEAYARAVAAALASGAASGGIPSPILDRPFILDGLAEAGFVPESLAGGLAAPIVSRGELAALVAFGPKRSRSYYAAADQRLVGMLARQASLAVDGAQLRREAEEAAEELRGERDRVSREMHDGVGGTLSNAIMLLGLVKGERDPGALAKRLAALELLLGEALADLRNLVWALHDGSGSPADLAAQLRERFEKATADQGVKASFRAELGPGADDGKDAQLNARERLNLVRAAQELVANGLKHSNAAAISLALEREDGSLALLYSDDGRGFDSAAPRGGYGLRNLARRCADIGAELSLDSTPGRGCAASIRLTLARR
jgi:signal transduction histidine kinase